MCYVIKYMYCDLLFLQTYWTIIVIFLRILTVCLLSALFLIQKMDSRYRCKMALNDKKNLDKNLDNSKVQISI